MSGWVLHTLTGALWAVQGADSYADAVWRAVSLGYDADTVAAVAGALAGAAWGCSAIPASLIQSLSSRHPMFAGEYPALLVALADDLVAGRGPLRG
jgi:ADP-ribosylglycohydrolase